MYDMYGRFSGDDKLPFGAVGRVQRLDRRVRGRQHELDRQETESSIHPSSATRIYCALPTMNVSKKFCYSLKS